jgi:hypothetical protein
MQQKFLIALLSCYSLHIVPSSWSEFISWDLPECWQMVEEDSMNYGPQRRQADEQLTNHLKRRFNLNNQEISVFIAKVKSHPSLESVINAGVTLLPPIDRSRTTQKSYPALLPGEILVMCIEVLNFERLRINTWELECKQTDMRALEAYLLRYPNPKIRKITYDCGIAFEIVDQ